MEFWVYWMEMSGVEVMSRSYGRFVGEGDVSG